MTTTKSSLPSAGPMGRSAGDILVPLDGSSIAEQALPVAGTIAHRAGRMVHLASVLHRPMMVFVGDPEAPIPDPGLEAELRRQYSEYLKSSAEALETTHGVEVKYALLEGTAAQSLAEYARLKRIGMIVMTTHGHGGIQRLWLGSVADRLLRRVKAPVLLLRPLKGSFQTEFRRVLIALDGLCEGEKILEPGIELGSLSPDCRFFLIQVVEPPVSLITRLAMQPGQMRPHWRELQENSARTYLDRVAGRMRARGLQVDTRLVCEHGIGEQILSLAGSIGADLLVVGTHGARGVERMLLGSVADKVIRGSSAPVLVVPTRQENE